MPDHFINGPDNLIPLSALGDHASLAAPLHVNSSIQTTRLDSEPFQRDLLPSTWYLALSHPFTALDSVTDTARINSYPALGAGLG